MGLICFYKLFTYLYYHIRYNYRFTWEVVDFDCSKLFNILYYLQIYVQKLNVHMHHISKDKKNYPY